MTIDIVWNLVLLSWLFRFLPCMFVMLSPGRCQLMKRAGQEPDRKLLGYQRHCCFLSVFAFLGTVPLVGESPDSSVPRSPSGHMLPRGARSFEVTVNLAVGKEKAQCWKNEVYAENRAHPFFHLVDLRIFSTPNSSGCNAVIKENGKR